KVSLILSTALALSMTLRARSAALRHWVLSVGVVCAAAAPALISIAPEWHVPLAATAAVPPHDAPAVLSGGVRAEVSVPTADALPTPHTAAATRPITMWQLLISAWIVGTLVAVATLVVGLARLSWIRSRAHPLDEGLWPELAREIATTNGIRRPVT